MNFLIIHNEYRDRGGEESVVAFQKELLQQKGHKVIMYLRNYHQADKWFAARLITTFTSIYNYRSIKDLKRIIKEFKPDIAIIHNVFSLISPCIIPFLHKNNIKVWQIVHNYRLFCPIGIFFTHGNICEKCLNKAREWNCVKNHCAENKLADYAFAFKFSIVRKLNYYKNVDRFYCLSKLQQKILKRQNIPQAKIYFLPNAVDISSKQFNSNIDNRHYIDFVGRLTYEKGFYDFVELAKMLPEYKFRIAGKQTDNVKYDNLPNNVELVGFLNKEQLQKFYSQSRVVVFLSKWYETFGLTVAEAMINSSVVITYDVSAAREIIYDAKTGYIVKNNDLNAVKDKIKLLFEDKELYIRLQKNAFERIYTEYSPQKYYDRLLNNI